MKNKEIEELLNELKWYEDAPNEQDYNGEYDPPLEWEQGEVKLLLSYIEQLENNRDKAIEYVESYFIFNDKTGECYQTHTFDKDNVKKLYDILKGDSDE